MKLRERERETGAALQKIKRSETRVFAGVGLYSTFLYAVVDEIFRVCRFGSSLD